MNFETYIYKVLKQVHPDIGITSDAKQQLNHLLVSLSHTIIETAHHLMEEKLPHKKRSEQPKFEKRQSKKRQSKKRQSKKRQSKKRQSKFRKEQPIEVKSGMKKSTISSREIQSAVRTIMFGESIKYSVSEGTKAVTKFTSDSGGRKGKPKTRSKMAGLVFSVSRMEHLIRQKFRRIGAGAPVYLAAVVEYICAEILELSGHITRNTKRRLITVRDMYISSEKDEELKKLITRLNFKFLGSGVILERKQTKPEHMKKGRKYLPGAKAYRDILKYQKQSNCLYIPKAPFERLVREIGHYYKADLRFTPDTIINLQYYVEGEIVELLRKANSVALHSDRQTVMVKDLKLVKQI